MDAIETSKDLSADNEKAVEAAIQDFKASNAY
jgi:F-type H+/Na+-transporting ATPase subunit alpha